MVTLDSATSNDFLMISKTLIPYLDRDKQRAVAIFIKAFELMSTIDLFSKEEFVTSITQPRNNGWEKKFLNDIKSNLSDDRAYFIDAILKLSEVKDLLGTKPPDQFKPSYPDNPYSSSEVSAASTSATIDSMPQSASNVNANTNNGPKPADVIDKLSGVLEPNQLQILKLISSFIK